MASSDVSSKGQEIVEKAVQLGFDRDFTTAVVAKAEVQFVKWNASADTKASRFKAYKMLAGRVSSDRVILPHEIMQWIQFHLGVGSSTPQLMYPEYRWSEHIREHEEVRYRSYSKSVSSPSAVTEPQPEENSLPYLALNEVFIGESLSSRVSYYVLQIDDGEKIKQKSSGITVCTGTGSTSWYFNINKMTVESISELMSIMNDELNTKLPDSNPELVSKIAKRFNDALIYDPDDPRMAFAVRDPVFNMTYPPAPSRGFCKQVVIKSRCYDAHLVIDGGLSYIFNDGASARLEIKPEDALRTVILR